ETILDALWGIFEHRKCHKSLHFPHETQDLARRSPARSDPRPRASAQERQTHRTRRERAMHHPLSLREERLQRGHPPKATRAQMQGAYPPCREVRLPSWQHPLVSENRRKLLQIVVCESGGSIRIHKRPVVWKFPDRVWKDVKTGRTHIAHHRRIETLSSSPWGTKDFKHLGHPVPA